MSALGSVTRFGEIMPMLEKNKVFGNFFGKYV